MKSLMTVDEAARLIRGGQRLFVSGEEALLASLPHGEWVGGTIAYFMSEEGGICSRDRVQVARLPDYVCGATIKSYTPGDLPTIPADYSRNGFSYIVIPGLSQAHQTFARDCSSWPGVFDRPLVGWIAGTCLENLRKGAPKVINGQTGDICDSDAVVMHVELPAGKCANVNIVNLFRQGNGDTITFPHAGFEVTDCRVNGQKQLFSHYLDSKKINIQLPLVADYRGAMVNVSLQSVDAQKGKVALYAPVFPGIEYKVALPVGDYETEFEKEFEKRNVKPVFTCNCILNYLYAKLEGKKTGHIVGPMTFGEIAYMLLNQTLVYLMFEDC
jgi:hypothetical protein